MAANPFAGTPFEVSWNQGFSSGYLRPLEFHPPPTPLAPEQHLAYSAGVIAGQAVSLGVNVPPDAPVERDPQESWEDIFEAEMVPQAVHSGHTGVELVKALTLKGGRLAAFTKTVGMWAILQFVEAAIWGPERGPFFEEAAAQALARTRRQLQENGLISDHIEMFMAACNSQSHQVSPQDELSRQGWWHGRVFLSFNQAFSEARAHGHLEETRIMRFQSAAPDTVEVLELT